MSTHANDGLLSVFESVLVIVVMALFAVTFIVQPSRIPSESMRPTLDVGDFLLIDKQAFTPTAGLDWALPRKQLQRGDVAIFHYPMDPPVHFVKRVIALPGDAVRLRGGHVFVNGEAIAEPYALFIPSVPDSFRDDFPSLQRLDNDVQPFWWATLRAHMHDGEIVVPPGTFFVLGDNRNDSLDSRYWGFVHMDALVGRPFLVDFTVPQSERPLLLRDKLRAMLHGMRIVR